MAERLPRGITYDKKNDEYLIRPYDKTTKKKGPVHRFPSLSEAVAFKERVSKGETKASSRQWTADEWVTEWTTNPGFKRPKESTNIHNAERVSKFGEDFKGVPLIQIDRAAAREWQRENKSRVAAVRAMLNDAMHDQIIPTNPFNGLWSSKKGPGRKHIQPMTEAEVHQLADVAYERWEDWPVFGSMVIFAAYTGLRLGELLALRWSDINWEKGTVLIERQWSQRTRTYTTTKNGRFRNTLLLEPAANALRLLERGGPAGDDLIWYSPRHKRIEQGLHDYYWRQARERFLGQITTQRAEEIDLEWHVLRHFFISHLVDKGIRPDDIAGAVGHTDGGRLVQELYGHLYPENSLTRMQKQLAA